MSKNQFQTIEAVLDTDKLQAMIDLRVEIAVKNMVREVFSGLKLNQQMSIAYLKKQGYRVSWHSLNKAIESCELPAQMGNKFLVQDLDIWAFQNLKTQKNKS